MTALAGVGSKLEAMQTRMEKNETATESMAEDLKSAVESLRAAEAAAAIAALPPTLATPAPAAPEVTPVAAPVPSPAPSVPEVHAPAAEVAPPVGRRTFTHRARRGSTHGATVATRVRAPRVGTRVRTPGSAFPRPASTPGRCALRQRPATAPPPGAPAADAAVPGCAAQRTASPRRTTRPPPPPPQPAAAAAAVLPAGATAGRVRWVPAAARVPHPAAANATTTQQQRRSPNPAQLVNQSVKVNVERFIDDFASMGFTRDQVRGVIRDLSDSGQTVDTNVVLDRLMNGRR